MREIVLGRVAVVPLSLVSAPGREVDAKRTEVLVVYPDDTKGSELDEIIRTTNNLANGHGEPA